MSARRRSAQLALAALLTTGIAAPGASSTGSPNAAADRVVAEPPDIIVVVVDDMRDDDLKYMPATRRMVMGKGVRFSNSYSTFPLCCPARATLLTGLYAQNHGVFGNHGEWGFRAFDDRSTVATWLRGAGYHTTFLGKYLNGYGPGTVPGADDGHSFTYVPPGWSRWLGAIDNGLPGHARGGVYQYFNTTLNHNGRRLVNYSGRYQTRVYGDLMQKIIRSRVPDDRPYFLFASFTAPHSGSPREPDDIHTVTGPDGKPSIFRSPARPEYVKGMFDSVIPSAPGASWHDPDFSDKPQYLRSLPLINAAERRAMTELTRQRAEALFVVDKQIARLVRLIGALRQWRRTVLLFTSDNGFFLGEQRRRTGKQLPHEPSLRVPMLMRGAGIPSGRVRRDPIATIDLAPTIAGFAGVSAGHVTDGVSMAGVAAEGDRGWTRPILTATGDIGLGLIRQTDLAGGSLQPGEQPDVRYAIGVRTPRYLYVDLATGERELYDLRSDPQQYRNLAGLPAYAGVEDALADVLSRMRACEGTECAESLPAPLLDAPPQP